MGLPEGADFVGKAQFGCGFAWRLDGGVRDTSSFELVQVERGLVMFVSAVVLLEAMMLPRGLSWRVVDVQIGGADTGVPIFVGLGFETGRFCLASVISARLAGLHRLYRPIVLLRCISQRQMRVLLEYPAAL